MAVWLLLLLLMGMDMRRTLLVCVSEKTKLKWGRDPPPPHSSSSCQQHASKRVSERTNVPFPLAASCLVLASAAAAADEGRCYIVHKVGVDGASRARRLTAAPRLTACRRRRCRASKRVRFQWMAWQNKKKWKMATAAAADELLMSKKNGTNNNILENMYYLCIIYNVCIYVCSMYVSVCLFVH
jgi:hypothetical protein